MKFLSAVITETNERLKSGATPQQMIEELTDVQKMIDKMLRDLTMRVRNYPSNDVRSARPASLESYREKTAA